MLMIEWSGCAPPRDHLRHDLGRSTTVLVTDLLDRVKVGTELLAERRRMYEDEK